MSRFDYVKYDEKANAAQADIKKICICLENEIYTHLDDGRARSLALTKLEEVYMWCGKGIRDAQIARNGSAELQEERGNE